MFCASLLTACGLAYPVSRAPIGDPIHAARALSDAPAAVRDSPVAESCGEFILDQGESVPTDAVQCLSAAANANQDAELAWTDPTTEGDPIVHFAFVTGNGTDDVVVYTTNEFDSYGGEFGWTKSSCSDLAAAISALGCPAP